MYWNEIKRISMAGGFVAGLITLAIKMFFGHSLLASAYTSIIVMMGSSIIFLIGLRLIGKVLANFLIQKKLEAMEEEPDNLTKAKQKVEELKQKRQNIQDENKRMFEEQIKVARGDISGSQAGSNQATEESDGQELNDHEEEVA